MADDLDTPLKARAGTPSRLPRNLLAAVTLGMAAVIAGVIGWIIIFDDPLGGEPRHVVKIEQILPDAQTKARTTNADAPRKEGPKGDPRTITIIDGNTGARREIVLDNRKEPAPQRTATPNPPESEPTSTLLPADKRLIESTKHGSIPKIGADGARSLDVYASPIPVAAAPADSMIAIVITGLGVSASGTNEAITRLPAAVTLGFVPYGNELTSWVGKARSTGHEVLLQVPMEPLDYPDNDPGPQTLTAAATQAQNLDRLHFFLSRTQGYVGVANLMGARLTANEEAMAAILAETGKRGLLFLDDGTSPRSVSQRAAQKANAPFLRADVVIDARTEWADIDAALVRLETIATERGVAIASASALPVTIERIARWAKTLDARGIRLVPVSTAFHRRTKQS